MAGGLIGALRVTLGIDTAAFEAGSKRAAVTAKRDAGLIESSFSKASSGVKTAMAGLAAGLSLGALVAVAQRALDYASSLDEVSQQLGVTSKDLQEYRYAATQVGISQEEMDKGLAKLTVTMGQARAGVEGPKAAFKQLSDLLGKDVLKSAATAGDAIPLIADALEKVKDPAQRAALEVSLFGKTGQKLDTLLAPGSGAINEMRDAAQQFGLVLSDDDIQNADKTADKIAEVKQVLEASIAKAVSENVSAIYDLANALEALITKIPSAINEMGKFFDYVSIGWNRLQVMQGIGAGNANQVGNSLVNIAGARNDLQTRANYGKKGWMDAQQKSVRDYAGQVGAHGAGAGTSDAARASAASKAKSDAQKAARAAKKAEDDRQKELERYNREMSGLHKDQWSLESDLTTDIEARAEFERKRIHEAAAAYAEELASKVALGELSAAHAKRLQLGKNYNTNLELDLVDQKLDDDRTRQALDLKDASLSLQSDLNRGELGEAKTQAERRVLQQNLLDIEYDRQRAALEAVLALNSSTQAEKDIATARLAQLPTLKAQDAESNRRATAGPLEAFGDSLHRTAGQIAEDFQQIEVDGIKSLNDGLIDAIVNSKSLGDVFSSVAKQILADLLKISLQSAESSLFGKGSGGGGGFLGSLLGGITSIFGGGHTLGGSSISSSLFKGLSAGNGIKGLAGGGTVQVGGSGGIDTNLMSINGMPAARVNRGEHIKVVPNKESDRTAAPIIMHNDFRGADADAVPRIEAKLDQLDRSLERRAVTAVGDATDRRVLRRG
ncbi:hypothetical protein U1872_12500 [Sphingomonas sp. RB3P16]|uniref:hypothetical protein n=1 Tax=Parasphingomonas frigoris TaxID=3096163 RepID=UPI002FC6227A